MNKRSVLSVMNQKSVWNRKKYQRAVNKIVRAWNKSIADDWLWNARFVLRQSEAYFHPHEDHSGAQFNVILEFTDTKTGKVVKQMFDNYDINWKLGPWLNSSITETWKVWDEDPNPNEQAKLEGRIPR